MRSLALALLVTACGGNSLPAWNKQPVKPVAGTVEGIAYTIDLPEGTTAGEARPGETQIEYKYHHDGRVFAPWVTVSKSYKKMTLAEGKDFDKKSPILHEAESPTGWIYAIENSAYKNSEDYIVRSETYVGDNALSCSVRFFPAKKGDTAKELIPDAEKICLSLKGK